MTTIMCNVIIVLRSHKMLNGYLILYRKAQKKQMWETKDGRIEFKSKGPHF